MKRSDDWLRAPFTARKWRDACPTRLRRVEILRIRQRRRLFGKERAIKTLQSLNLIETKLCLYLNRRACLRQAVGLNQLRASLLGLFLRTQMLTGEQRNTPFVSMAQREWCKKKSNRVPLCLHMVDGVNRRRIVRRREGDYFSAAGSHQVSLFGRVGGSLFVNISGDE